jgi:hypothetical protein
VRGALTNPSAVRDYVSEHEIAALLADGGTTSPADPASFTSSALRHAVAPLVVKSGVVRRLPPELGSRLIAEARKQAVITELRERELVRVLEALHRNGIDALLIKGVHLASSCYQESYLRPREDTDLLVRASVRARVTAVLAELGYVPLPVQTGADVLGQTVFDCPGRVAAALDVHWRISQPFLAASLFDFDDLLSRATPLPRLGPFAKGPSAPDALALACVHQAAHHAGQDLLLWTYDIHLLMSAFSPEDVEKFVSLATGRRICEICIAAIEPAESLFGTPAAGKLLAPLRRAAGREPSAALLVPGGRLQQIGRDLRAVPSWSQRARLVAGHMFPPAAYMRATYAPSSTAPMAWLYLRRLLRAGS